MFFKHTRKIHNKQANIMGSFAGVLTNNQTKNINKIGEKIRKKLETFNHNVSQQSHNV